MALGRQSLTPGEAPAALGRCVSGRGPVRVSDASHACGLDDLNAVPAVGQALVGEPPREAGRSRSLSTTARKVGLLSATTKPCGLLAPATRDLSAHFCPIG